MPPAVQQVGKPRILLEPFELACAHSDCMRRVPAGHRGGPCGMTMSRHVWRVRAHVAEGLARARHTAASV